MLLLLLLWSLGRSDRQGYKVVERGGGEGGERRVNARDGCEYEWREGKDVTLRVSVRRRREKGITRQGRIFNGDMRAEGWMRIEVRRGLSEVYMNVGDKEGIPTEDASKGVSL